MVAAHVLAGLHQKRAHDALCSRTAGDLAAAGRAAAAAAVKEGLYPVGSTVGRAARFRAHREEEEAVALEGKGGAALR